MQHFLALLMILILFFRSQAQTATLLPLNIGSKIPNVCMSSIFDRKDKKVLFSEFKGKLVILDFWNIWCHSCISAMPKMDALQKKFGDKIQIIMVTKNSKEQVEKLFSKIKIRRPNVLMVINDSTLNYLFPHKGDPHHVWIGKDGTVQYITEGYNATPENIEAALNGKQLDLSLKLNLKGFDDGKPLLTEAAGRLSASLQYYSLLLKGLYESTGSNRVEVVTDSITKKPVMIHAINASILTLFNIAFSKALFGFNVNVFRLTQNNRILLEMKEPAALFYPKDSSMIDLWKSKNLFSYELKLPNESSDDIYQIMQQDLNRFFSYSGTIEKRKRRCLVLIRTTYFDELKENNGSPIFTYKEDGSLEIENMPLSTSLMRSMVYSNQNIETPIIDGTNYVGNIKMHITSSLTDLVNLRRELKQYGFDLIEEEREIAMLVIRERR